MLIYLNELLPTRGDLRKLREEMRQGITDVVPEPGSEVDGLLRGWDGKGPEPELPFEFRLRRAIRVIPVTEGTMAHALEQFDQTVARIEVCRGKELEEGRVLNTWEKNPAQESTYTACDARTFLSELWEGGEAKVAGGEGVMVHYLTGCRFTILEKLRGREG